MEAEGEKIHILETPTDFYQQLVHGIDRATSRIAIASLYVGSGETDLIAHLEAALSSRRQLQLDILVDHMRGTRPDKDQSSTATLLSPLAIQFPERVRIAFFQFPSVNPARTLVGPRFNEAFGLQHIKAYVFDNDVIVSGANLNSDYFTNRQDRYILIKDNPQLASHFSKIISKISTYSNTVSPTNPGEIVRHSHSLADMKQGLKQLTGTYSTNKPLHIRPSASDPETIITPLFQAGPLNMLEESQAFENILKNAGAEGGEGASVVISSAYFNLPRRFHDTVLKSRAKYQFLLAAPEANGFFGSKGISRHLPFAYTFLTHEFWKKVLANGKQDQIEIREYFRKGWTYHAKGLWISAPGKHPHMTMIGSSNYGYRSLNRDLEAQVVIQTRNVDLQKRLGENLHKLQSYSHRVDEKTFSLPERLPNLFVRIATRIIKGML